MGFILSFITAAMAMLIGFSLPAAAQSGRTFYIDYVGGSNANPGTEASPWKTHPYMQTGASCTGTGSAPSYSHQAGDQFIFKGGVTWPAACFQLSISNGGSSNAVRDYYGADIAWYTGGSFTRPVFDMANTTPTGNSFIKIRADNITFDNLELKRMKILSGVGECSDANFDMFQVSNITVQKSYIHDWTITSDAANSTTHGTGSICQNRSPLGNIIALNDELSDAATTNPVPFGACFRNLSEVANSECHDTAEGIVGHGAIHDSEFYNINGTAQAALDPLLHTNVIEASAISTGDGPIYNNFIHDTNAGVTIFDCNQANIYNNVMWNNANFAIMLDSNCPGATSGTVANIYNNTVDCSATTACFRVMARSNGTPSVLNLQNNYWIANGNPVCYNAPGNGCGGVAGGNQANNITASASTAASQGYTASNRYQPMSAASATVKAALNLSGLCSGALSSLCSDILHGSRLSPWDVGAYQFGTQSPSAKPNAPSNLAATVQ
jgi:hypothetical protein